MTPNHRVLTRDELARAHLKRFRAFESLPEWSHVFGTDREWCERTLDEFRRIGKCHIYQYSTPRPTATWVLVLGEESNEYGEISP